MPSSDRNRKPERNSAVLNCVRDSAQDGIAIKDLLSWCESEDIVNKTVTDIFYKLVSQLSASYVLSENEQVEEELERFNRYCLSICKEIENKTFIIDAYVYAQIILILLKYLRQRAQECENAKVIQNRLDVFIEIIEKS